MKIIIENTTNGILVNLEKNEEKQVILFTDIVATLEYAKQLVLNDWNRAIAAQAEQMEEVETQ